MAAIGKTRLGRGAARAAAFWPTPLLALALAAGCDAPGPGAPTANGAPAETGAVSPVGETGAGPTTLTYANRIRPMLEPSCLGCHGRWLPQASLSMTSREGLIRGGRSGPAIVPGDSTKGWLMHTLTVDSGKYRMPPEGPRLSESQVEVIRRWIDAGAP